MVIILLQTYMKIKWKKMKEKKLKSNIYAHIYFYYYSQFSILLANRISVKFIVHRHDTFICSLLHRFYLVRMASQNSSVKNYPQKFHIDIKEESNWIVVICT